MVQLLRQLASRHDSLLLWHLEKHKSALGLCIAFIAGNGSMSAFDDPEAMYTSDEEDYFSEDEEVIMVITLPVAVTPSYWTSERLASKGIFHALHADVQASLIVFGVELALL